MRNTFVVAIGKKGSGKTQTIRVLTEPCRRAIFADPEHKWPAGPADTTTQGASQFIEALRDLDAQDPSQPFRIIYRDDAPVMQTAAPALALAMRNCTLVWDELAWAMTPHYLPPYFRQLIQFGREVPRVNLVGTTREPQELHDFVYSQADLLLFFHTDPGNGLDRLWQRYPRHAALLPDLPTLHYVEWRSDPDAACEELFGAEGDTLLL